jgi:hypothetical protein
MVISLFEKFEAIPLTLEQMAERDKQRKARKKLSQHIWYEKQKAKHLIEGYQKDSVKTN